MAELGKYRDDKGHVFSMTAEHAKRMGYRPVEGPQAEPADAEQAATTAQETAPEEETEGKARQAAATKAVKGPPKDKGR